MARQAILRVSADMLVQMCKPRRFYDTTCEVVENALPEDAHVVGFVDLAEHPIYVYANQVGLVIESAEFADIQDGDRLPILPDPAFKLHYHERVPAVAESILIPS